MINLGDIGNGLVFDSAVVEVSSNPLGRLNAHVHIGEACIPQDGHSMLVDQLWLNKDLKRQAHISWIPLGEIFEPIQMKLKTSSSKRILLKSQC